MLETLLLQSVLVRPMYFGEEPPPVRSCEHILIVHAETEGPGILNERTSEEAMALANEIVEKLREGGDFAKLAAEHSDAWDAKRNTVLGTFARGMLLPELDEFLFSAEVGEFSAPIVLPDQVRILRRVETFAAVRQVYVRGAEGGERAEAIAREIRAGADFATIARERSEDPVSAARGGDYQIFERGPRDASIKKVAFEMEVGEIRGPIQSPQGFHILQRAPLDELDPALRETTFIRARAILLSHHKVKIEQVRNETRSAAQALRLAHELRRKILAGEDMAELAREHDDDPGGRERAGDLGWVHRRAPDLPKFMGRVFVQKMRDVPRPYETSVGYVLIRREE